MNAGTFEELYTGKEFQSLDVFGIKVEPDTTSDCLPSPPSPCTEAIPVKTDVVRPVFGTKTLPPPPLKPKRGRPKKLQFGERGVEPTRRGKNLKRLGE